MADDPIDPPPGATTIPEGRPAPAQLQDPAGPRDYDSDPQGGGGKLPEQRELDAPEEGADAPVHGSR